MKQTKKQVKKVNKKHESGRSMIEMVGVLAVMGLITAGAFVLITSAMRSQKISRADDDVSAIAAGVRLLYNASTDFSGINAANDSGKSTLQVIGYDKVTPPYGAGTYSLVGCKPTYSNNKLTGCTAANDSSATHFMVEIPMNDDKAQCDTLAGRSWAGTGTGVCVKVGDKDNRVQVVFGKE